MNPTIPEIAADAAALAAKIKALHAGVETPFAKIALAYAQGIAPALENHALSLKNWVGDFDKAIAAKQPTPPVPFGTTLDAIRKANDLAQAKPAPDTSSAPTSLPPIGSK